MPAKLILCAAMLALIMPASEGGCGSSPRELAGFVIGDRVEKYRDRLREDTVLPIRFFESLKEVSTVPLIGYKTSLVVYGTCRQPPRIIRLKFKYADSSEAFYYELLEHYKKRFGEPDQWRGDPFGIVTAWKWSFLDKQGNDISLVLQHNLKDEDEKQGNSVKLTMWSLMRAESRCFERKMAEPGGPDRDAAFEYEEGRPIDWDRFVPK